MGHLASVNCPQCVCIIKKGGGDVMGTSEDSSQEKRKLLVNGIIPRVNMDSMGQMVSVFVRRKCGRTENSQMLFS